MELRLPPPKCLHDDAERSSRDKAFLADIANTIKTITIRLQRNHLRGDALADAVAETVAICWESFSAGKRNLHGSIGFAVAETRSRLRAVREAQRQLAEWNWPTTLTDRIAYEYPDSELAVVEARVPAVPVENAETRKRSFVKPTDFQRPKTFPTLCSETMGDMEAAEQIHAMDVREKLAMDAAWIGCPRSSLLDAIERSLEAACDN